MKTFINVPIAQQKFWAGIPLPKRVGNIHCKRNSSK
jgi:hypothetical protein